MAASPSFLSQCGSAPALRSSFQPPAIGTHQLAIMTQRPGGNLWSRVSKHAEQRKRLEHASRNNFFAEHALRLCFCRRASGRKAHHAKRNNIGGFNPQQPCFGAEMDPGIRSRFPGQLHRQRRPKNAKTASATTITPMIVKMLYMLLLQCSEAKRDESHSRCQAIISLPGSAGAARQLAAYSASAAPLGQMR